MESIPFIARVLFAMLLVSTALAFGTRGRGGHFRGLVGWVGFWWLFAAILAALSRAHTWVALVLLALFMFGGLRAYFSIVPLRPKDRTAILGAFLTIPVALWPGFTGSSQTFLVAIPLLLFLLFPALLSLGPIQDGFIDSVGRILLGVLVFCFCAAHLALLAGPESPGHGLPELYGVLVLATELPQRLSGRFGPGVSWRMSLIGVIAGAALACAMGYLLAPYCGLVEEDGARVGLLTAVGVTLGAAIGEALTRDLRLGSSRVGRAAFLDRVVPAVYAAPIFYHYLNHFA